MAKECAQNGQMRGTRKIVTIPTRIDSGVPKAQAYNITMYIMAGLLVIGFISNSLIQAVDDRHHMALDTVDDAVGVA